MKKGYLLLGTTVAVLTLATGCGGKTLTCTYESGDYVRKAIYKYDKDGEKLKSVTQEITGEFDDDDDLDDAYDEAKEECEEYEDEDYKGITCKVKKKKDKITQTVTMNFSKMDDDTLDDLYIDLDDFDDLEDMKDNLEDSDWECK